MDRTELPGVGSRFTLPLRAGGRLEIVAYANDQREIFIFTGDDEASACVRLDGGESCTLAALLCDALARAHDQVSRVAPDAK